MTIQTKELIQGIVNIFETSKFAGDYAALVVMHDGPGGSTQITYGRSQLTESGGGLRRLLLAYQGKYAAQLMILANKFDDLTDNEEFKNLLVLAARDDEAMRKAQDAVFDENYWHPALRFCEHEGLTLPLSQLLVYDSYIHSGKVPQFLRDRFNELTPVRGGNEKKWCRAYAQARRDWLATHSSPLLRKTVYRMDFILGQMDADNWMLNRFPLNVHGVIVK